MSVFLTYLLAYLQLHKILTDLIRFYATLTSDEFTQVYCCILFRLMLHP